MKRALSSTPVLKTSRGKQPTLIDKPTTKKTTALKKIKPSQKTGSTRDTLLGIPLDALDSYLMDDDDDWW